MRLIGIPVALLVGVFAWISAGQAVFVLARPLAALVVASVLYAAWRRDGAPTLLSPLALLSLQSLALYSLLPWLLLGLHRHFMVNTSALLGTYLGSRAEALVLGFAAILAATRLALEPSPWRGSSPGGFLGRRGMVLALSAALGGVLLFLAFRFGADTMDDSARQIRDGLMPMALTAAALLHVHWLGRPRLHLRFALAALALGGVLVLAGTGKPVFYSFGGAFLWWLVASPLPWRRCRLPLLGGFVILGLAAITAFAFVRDHGVWHRLSHHADEPLRILTEKVVDRQLETGWCFKNVMDESWRIGEPARALYFAAALVPRVVWPDKPSLSVGGDLGVRYCAKDPAWHHSASVTLLGEPVIEAGALGLTAALAACLGGLALLTVLGGRAGPVGLSLWIGLAPWLVDFDQTFAMYVANGVKSILYAAPVWLVVLWWWRKEEGGSCAE